MAFQDYQKSADQFVAAVKRDDWATAKKLGVDSLIGLIGIFAGGISKAGKAGKAIAGGVEDAVSKLARGSTSRFVLPLEQRGVLTFTTTKWERYDKIGTKLWTAPGAPIAEKVLETGIPLGFESAVQLKGFVTHLSKGLRDRGFHGVRIGIRGSAINGRSYNKKAKDFTGPFFDTGPGKASDFDIAIVNPDLANEARRRGIGVSGNSLGQRTRPLNEEDLEELGMNELIDELKSQMGGRDVSIMIYSSERLLRSRGPMMLLN